MDHRSGEETERVFAQWESVTLFDDDSTVGEVSLWEELSEELDSFLCSHHFHLFMLLQQTIGSG